MTLDTPMRAMVAIELSLLLAFATVALKQCDTAQEAPIGAGVASSAPRPPSAAPDTLLAILECNAAQE